METRHVVAAIIRGRDGILAAMRSNGEQSGFWEFPGGKVERGGGDTRRGPQEGGDIEELGMAQSSSSCGISIPWSMTTRIFT